MALTLTEAAKLANDVVLQGVIETVAKESDVLNYLPFIDVLGNGLTYNRENGSPMAGWYDVGDTWVEQTPTFTQATAALKIVGGDADVDNYIRMTRGNVQDIEAAVLQLKARAVKDEFEDKFINGDSSTNAKQFDGLAKLVMAGQTVSAGDNGATLTLAMVDQLIDTVRPGKPDLLLMSKRSRRKIKQLRATQGNYLETAEQFGRMVTFYDGIPIAVTDWQSDTETKGGSGAVCSSIWAVRFGEGFCAGLTNGGITLERIGILETKDATRTRIKWYCGLALFSTLALAKLEGVKD
ncbi:MAG: phage major capsid protein [Chloroflexota bacterium]|nr:MAG: phage major capsid protein [Chloroflexota bacterium]